MAAQSPSPFVKHCCTLCKMHLVRMAGPPRRGQERTGIEEQLHLNVFLTPSLAHPQAPMETLLCAMTHAGCCITYTSLTSSWARRRTWYSSQTGLLRAGVGCGLVGLALGCGGWFRKPGICVPFEGGQEAIGATEIPSKEAEEAPPQVSLRGSQWGPTGQQWAGGDS